MTLLRSEAKTARLERRAVRIEEPLSTSLRYLHLDGLRFCFLRLRQMEIQHPILELGLDLLLIDHIRQREGPDNAPVRAFDPMNRILSIFS